VSVFQSKRGRFLLKRITEYFQRQPYTDVNSSPGMSKNCPEMPESYHPLAFGDPCHGNRRERSNKSSAGNIMIAAVMTAAIMMFPALDLKQAKPGVLFGED
jgi:hypothetical protein